MICWNFTFKYKCNFYKSVQKFEKENSEVKIVDNGHTNSNFYHFDDSKKYTGWSTLRIFVCLVDGNFQISCLQCPFCLLFSLWSKQCARGSCCLLLLLFSSLCCLLSSRQSLNATLHRAKWGELFSERTTYLILCIFFFIGVSIKYQKGQNILKAIFLGYNSSKIPIQKE